MASVDCFDNALVGLRSDKPIWPAPYNELTAEAAYRWLTECWRTDDPAEQRTDLVPKKKFIRRFCRRWLRSFLTRTPMIVEKSRRLVISWVSRGLECWALGIKAGGLLIVDQTHLASSEHLWRIYHGLSRLIQDRPRLKIPPIVEVGKKRSDVPAFVVSGSILKHEVTSISFPNGALLQQCHQEAGTAQGKGKTIIVLEEVSTYGAPSEFFDQALLVTQGSADGKGGWVYAIANAKANPGWQKIKGGNSARKMLGLDGGDQPEDVGYAEMELANGTVHVAIHYTADEDKRSAEWLEKERRRFSQDGGGSLVWNREMELMDEIFDGDPVYADFKREIHCPPVLMVQDWPLTEGAVYIAGVDCGTTIYPAFCLLEVGPAPDHQVACIMEITSTTTDDSGQVVRKPRFATEFIPACIHAVQKLLPRTWQDVMWASDATAVTRAGTDGRTFQSVAAEHGIYIEPMPNAVLNRINAVNILLIEMIAPDCPKFFLSGKRCPLILQGFMGAYHWRKGMDGVPEKNLWSDGGDALQYSALKVNQLLKGRRTTVHHSRGNRLRR